MELNYRDRVARVTIVYYGPPAGGKTTNLRALHVSARPDHRGDIVSVDSSQGRTLLFDLLPLGGLGLAGWEVKFRVLGVPGQAAYAAARRLVLRGVDAAVFVANSATDRWYDNEPSLREMVDGLILHAIDPRTIPLVFQYNKRDLLDVMPLEAMDEALNVRKVQALAAVATRGENVLETFAAIVERVVEDVTQRYRNLALPSGITAAQWTHDSFLRVFGTTKLAPRQVAAVQAAVGVALPPDATDRDVTLGRRVVRVAVPETPARPGADVRSDPDTTDRLVATYAQASFALGQTADDLREQRDEARRFLEDLQHTLAAVESLTGGHDAQEALRTLLTRLAATARCRRASLVAPVPGGGIQVVASLTREPEVLANYPNGTQLIVQHLLQSSLFVVNDPQVPSELANALARASPPVLAVASLPLRYVSGIHAVFLLYFGSSDPLPSEAELAHLEWMGRGLSAALLARRALAQARYGRNAMADAVAGEAALRALAWLGSPARGVGPVDPRSLGLARTLLDAVWALKKGQLQARPEPLDAILYLLRQGGVQVVGEPALVVRGDATLLRLALEVLVEVTSEGQSPPVKVWARRERGHIAIAISGRRAVVLSPSTDPRTLLAERVLQLHAGEVRTGEKPGAPAFMVRLPAG